MSDANDSEIYVFEGNEGEKVPETAKKLIVSPGVRILPSVIFYSHRCVREVSLPDGLIEIGNNAFYLCKFLLEIKIPSTVQFIGKNAFNYCSLLKKVEFEETPTSPSQLKIIDGGAFRSCHELSRIKIPSSVTKVNGRTFDSCHALIEANLSTTCVTEISEWAFDNCPWLQIVGLPNTLKRIRRGAFRPCPRLVTVVVPLDGHPIRIGKLSFWSCSSLANLVLPKDSSAKEDSFDGCTLLQDRFGANSTSIVAGLVSRFGDLTIHQMCYDHSATTAEKLRQCIEQDKEEASLVDTFGMTPFHVLFSTIEPSVELSEVLLDHYPHDTLKWLDANGFRPLDYLVNNWNDATARLFQATLQRWMIDGFARLGAMSWIEAMESKVQAVLSEHDDEDERWMLYEDVYSAFGHYEQMAATSTLELALWKGQLKGAIDEERTSVDRQERRCLCGADVVIPNVFKFLV